jgi:TorA maturation chaperone TorD
MVEYDGKNDGVLKGYSMLLYFGGSFVLDQPEESCIYDLANGDIFKKMPVESSNPNYLMATSYLHHINSKAAINYEEILNDHLNLFGGMGKPKAEPIESAYLSEKESILKPSSLDAGKRYESYGWNPIINDSKPKDHLGFEIQFLNLMLEKYFEIEDGVCHAELTADIHNFIDQHLIGWVEIWNRKIQDYARSDFYKGVGYLIVASIQDIRSIV